MSNLRPMSAVGQVDNLRATQRVPRSIGGAGQHPA
jgi:hypothetical protein